MYLSDLLACEHWPSQKNMVVSHPVTTPTTSPSPTTITTTRESTRSSDKWKEPSVTFSFSSSPRTSAAFYIHSIAVVVNILCGFMYH